MNKTMSEMIKMGLAVIAGNLVTEKIEQKIDFTKLTGVVSENDRIAFFKAKMQLPTDGQKAIDDIYDWWRKDMRRSEDTLIRIISSVPEDMRKEFLSSLAQKWAGGDKNSIETTLRQLDDSFEKTLHEIAEKLQAKAAENRRNLGYS